MISTILLRTSIILLLIGMLVGIIMGIMSDFRLAPAHAHWNLIGFVLMFGAGMFYRLVPAAEKLGLAKAHVWLHIIGAIVFPIGIAVVNLYGESYVIMPIIGSLIVITAMAAFAGVIFRSTAATT